MGLFTKNKKPMVVIKDAKREIKPTGDASRSYVRDYKNPASQNTILKFSATRSFYPYVELDDNRQYLKILNNSKGMDTYISYAQITGCEIYIDDMPSSNTGLLGAVAGGALFGSTGAVVGGIAGKKNTEYIESVSVRTRTNSSSSPAVVIKTLKYRSQSGTKTVSKAIEDARAIEDLVIYAMNSKQNVAQLTSTKTEENDLGYIEELRKLKELVDEGVLTQEEFEAKKKQLLS